MEEKLFKTALEFINKYKIVSYAITIYPHPSNNWGNRIKIQGSVDENENVIDSLDMKFSNEDQWFTFSDGGIDLTLTKE